MLALHADNTQTVQRGQLLVEMDPAVANVNLAAAEANLARAVRTVKGEFSHADSSDAPSWRRPRWRWPWPRTDYQRRQQASTDGAVRARNWPMRATMFAAAEAAVAAAKGGHDQTLSQIAGHRCRQQSRCAGGGGALRNAVIALGPYAHRRAGGRRDRPTHGAGGPAGGGGHAADGGGAAQRCLDRCQFQGSPARRTCASASR